MVDLRLNTYTFLAFLYTILPYCCFLWFMIFFQGRRFSMLSEVTDGTFSHFINQSVAVLSFTSPWCAACKKIHTHLDELERSYKHISFGTIDISTNPETPAQLQVFSIPTIIVFKNNHESKRLSGTITEKDIRREIDTPV
jgi:thiol-disulfide isomerase/thioredoxin